MERPLVLIPERNAVSEEKITWLRNQLCDCETTFHKLTREVVRQESRVQEIWRIASGYKRAGKAARLVLDYLEGADINLSECPRELRQDVVHYLAMLQIGDKDHERS